MSTYFIAVGLSVVGGLGGLLVASGVLLINDTTRARLVPWLVSYAVGALLGVSTMAILPTALEQLPASRVLGTLLIGILLFFFLEKLVLWRHCHGEECEVHEHLPSVTLAAIAATPGHEHDNGRSGMLIMLGDTFHNFVDGILIAAAFMADIQLGIVTSIAIIAHEIPQEAGDFLILLNSGYTRRQALLFNLLSSFATLLGGILTYFMLQDVNHLIPSLLGLAAASMIYVAMSDLIPGLHKRPEIGATIQQVALITLGISSIWLANQLFSHHA